MKELKFGEKYTNYRGQAVGRKRALKGEKSRLEFIFRGILGGCKIMDVQWNGRHDYASRDSL